MSEPTQTTPPDAGNGWRYLTPDEAAKHVVIERVDARDEPRARAMERTVRLNLQAGAYVAIQRGPLVFIGLPDECEQEMNKERTAHDR